ncbi:MAG: hypothetical protein AB1502_07295 [Thermodesulfobacteriota bacterium]
MGQFERWFREKQVERTINALKKNNFEALFVSDSKAAFEEVMKRIPDGATIGVGGIRHPCPDWNTGCLRESEGPSYLAF